MVPDLRGPGDQFNMYSEWQVSFGQPCETSNL
jgi:hypothetical protein